MRRNKRRVSCPANGGRRRIYDPLSGIHLLHHCQRRPTGVEPSAIALGLAVVGVLSRVVMKTAAAHRAESQSIDDQDQHVSVDERRDHSLISAASDSGLFRAESSDYQTAHQISKRRDKLAQLRQVAKAQLQNEAVYGLTICLV